MSKEIDTTTRQQAKCQRCKHGVQAGTHGGCKYMRHRDGRIDWERYRDDLLAGKLDDCDMFEPKGTI